MINKQVEREKRRDKQTGGEREKRSDKQTGGEEEEE